MMIAGIDEAGKGPVIGPMCIGGVKIEESRAHILKVLGVADSNKLTPKKREQLAAQIKKHADGIFILEVSSAQIDELRKIMSMNEIMVACFSKVLEQLKPDLVYVDAADVKAERFAENLRRQYAKTSPAHAKEIEIISMHQADAFYTHLRHLNHRIGRIALRTITNSAYGYPHSQPSSGMFLKFIP